MKKSLLLIGLVATLLLACKNDSKVNQNDETTEREDATNHHGAESTPVLLNHGEKWIANAETTDGIKKMHAMIMGFSDNSKAADYQLLKVKLEAEFDLILQKCTMKGEAHNQLHNYLLPMKKMFEDLNSQDITIRKKALNTLSQHIQEYENYFQ